VPTGLVEVRFVDLDDNEFKHNFTATDDWALFAKRFNRETKDTFFWFDPIKWKANGRSGNGSAMCNTEDFQQLIRKAISSGWSYVVVIDSDGQFDEEEQ
jgi:hypothetical protein